MIWNLETYAQTKLDTESMNVAFSPDSSRVITSYIGTIKFWRCDDGAQLGEFSPSPYAWQMTLFPEGDGMVVAGRDGVVEWWRINQDMPRVAR